MQSARYVGFTALACLSTSDLASAAATMESIGAEKCGGRVTGFEVEFLAPDGAALEGATAKVLVRGAPSAAQVPLHSRSTGSLVPTRDACSRPAKARPTSLQLRQS